MFDRPSLGEFLDKINCKKGGIPKGTLFNQANFLWEPKKKAEKKISFFFSTKTECVVFILNLYYQF